MSIRTIVALPLTVICHTNHYFVQHVFLIELEFNVELLMTLTYNNDGLVLICDVAVNNSFKRDRIVHQQGISIIIFQVILIFYLTCFYFIISSS